VARLTKIAHCEACGGTWLQRRETTTEHRYPRPGSLEARLRPGRGDSYCRQDSTRYVPESHGCDEEKSALRELNRKLNARLAPLFGVLNKALARGEATKGGE
jgi:hypothetical protein